MTNSRISFIVIGQNEGWKLLKCITGIYETIQINNLIDHEIIYVDSQSTDDTLQNLSVFPELKILKLTNEMNAAIARNVGALESTGSILFFIDGDMQILPDFMQSVLNDDLSLKFDCVTGHLDDIFYEYGSTDVSKRFPRTYKDIKQEARKSLVVNGGIFLVKRQLWEKLGGMDSRFKKSQDIDFTLRLSKIGIETIRIPQLIALHYTVDYKNDKRMWNMLFSGSQKYPALIFRDHFFNRKLFVHTLRSHYTTFLFMLTLILFFVNHLAFCISGGIYMFILLAKVFLNSIKAKTSKNKTVYFFERVFYQILRDVIFWYSFLFFFPVKKQVSYVR